MIIPDNLSGFVNVTASVDIVDVFKALPEQEQTWALLKAFWLFTPENVRRAVEIYLEQPPEEEQNHEKRRHHQR